MEKLQVFCSIPQSIGIKKLVYWVLSIWLVVLFCTTIHEIGHALALISYGSTIYSININPIFCNGSVNHSLIPYDYTYGIVLISGLLCGFLGTSIAYYIRKYLAAIVSALCGVAELFNFMPTSDISNMINIFGNATVYAFIFASLVFLLLIVYLSYQNIFRQLKIYRSFSNLEI